MNEKCPTANELAAFVDGGLEPDAVLRIRAHVAECEDCAELFAEIGAFRELEAVEPGKWGRGRVLALAASLLVVVGATWWLSSLPGDPLTRIARRAPELRSHTVRMTSLEFRPRVALRGGSGEPRADWKLRAELGRLRELVEDQPTGRELHALGVALLLAGETLEAVEVLERAEAATSSDPVSTDLAAARVEAGIEEGDPELVGRGLDAIDRLLRQEDGSAVASTGPLLFNRAVALTALERPEQAEEAWRDVLAHEPDSPWAEEAREQLRTIESPAAEQIP